MEVVAEDQWTKVSNTAGESIDFSVYLTLIFAMVCRVLVTVAISNSLVSKTIYFSKSSGRLKT